MHALCFMRRYVGVVVVYRGGMIRRGGEKERESEGGVREGARN